VYVGLCLIRNMRVVLPIVFRVTLRVFNLVPEKVGKLKRMWIALLIFCKGYDIIISYKEL
jgi:hypothetical protein